jgi:hypothetical protein
VTVIPRRLDTAGLNDLPRHDVVLALSVLHHIADWRAALPALVACRSHLVIEVCHPDERWMRRAASRRDVRVQHDTVAGWPGAVRLGESERVGRDGVTYLRPLFRIPGSVRALAGVAFTGSGSCSRNMPRNDRGLGDRLGYEPVPGSLNVRLPAPHRLGRPAVDWVGQNRRDRQLWQAWIRGERCHAHVPGARSHGPDVLELVAPFHLRDRYGIADGDTVTFDVEAGL